MLIDAHCHLFFEQYDADRDAMLKSARECGVRAFVNVGIDEASTLKALKLAEEHADVYATVGLHPHSAHLVDEAGIVRIAALAKRPKIVAVGEIGLDYFKSEAPRDLQRRIFERMIGVARDNELPVVVHSRDAFDDTLSALSAAGAVPSRTVFHCFSYDAAALERALEAGYVISFTCNVTYPSAKPLHEAVRRVPMGRFMIETDSPYLAPQALRGRRNDPSNLKYLVAQIASLKSVPPEEVEASTTRVSAGFFGIPVKGLDA